MNKMRILLQNQLNPDWNDVYEIDSSDLDTMVLSRVRENKTELHAMIDDIASSFQKQLKVTRIADGLNRDAYNAAIRDDMIAMAIVVKKHCPSYNLDRFYNNAGYAGTHPIH